MKTKKIVLVVITTLFILGLVKTNSLATNTGIEKVKNNGIYKIALGVDSSKAIEVLGGNSGNNATIDLYNYRKSFIPKILF